MHLHLCGGKEKFEINKTEIFPYIPDLTLIRFAS